MVALELFSINFMSKILESQNWSEYNQSIKRSKIVKVKNIDSCERGMFMLCQNCQQRKANVNMRFRLNGQEKQLHLCQTCYESQKQHLSANMGPSLNLGGFGGPHSFPLDDMI